MANAVHNPIWFGNSKQSQEEVEQVNGDEALRWVCGTSIGQQLVERVLSGRFLSRVYGTYQSSSLSKHKIAPFIKRFAIPMEEFQNESYSTFNEFFIRAFKPGVR